ncbi:MAG: hypothetical protein RIQ60_3468 [Pseudomonadota bacterium]|jgi:hypothetical protein
MHLNLPLLDRLQGARSVLIAGIGGGYDVFCGLPIYLELRRLGLQVHLANYGFSDIAGCAHGTRLSPTLVGVRADHEDIYPYFPEYYLARWLARSLGEDIPVWAFHKTGAQPLTANYAQLVEHLAVDALVLVDGGVDSLMRGDEAETGTLVEDSISMAAVRTLAHIRTKLQVCVGMGAERDMAHAQVFENIAALAAEDAFLGSCSFTRGMPVVRQYLEAVREVHAQPFHDPSVINASVSSAVDGHFGDHHATDKTRGSRLWISPLMPILWCFDFDAVARRNLVLDVVQPSQTFREALMDVAHHMSRMTRRPYSRVGLP